MNQAINNGIDEKPEMNGDIPVGRELGLKDILGAGDVVPLLKALAVEEVETAAVADYAGNIIWSAAASASPLSVGTPLPVTEDIRQGRLSGPNWKCSFLRHEGEEIGILFISRSASSERPDLGPLSGVASACLGAMIRINAKRLLTTDIHLSVVQQSYSDLVETNRRLSESLQVKVDEQTAELKKAFAVMARQDKLSSIGRLAAGIAHEINNPMAFIYSNLNTFAKYMNKMKEMILFYRDAMASSRSFPEAEERYRTLKIDYILKDSFDLISQSTIGAQRIKQIVSDMKDFSHIDDAKHILVDLGAEMEKALNVLAFRITEASAKVIREYSTIPMIEGDPSNISLAFLNILNNALESCDAIDTECRGLTIKVETSQSNGKVTAAVTDNGRGIPENIRSRVFEPFFTTKGVGKGTGMGLTVAYDIVTAHGGDLEVKSEDGKGTTVIITLPFKAETK